MDGAAESHDLEMCAALQREELDVLEVRHSMSRGTPEVPNTLRTSPLASPSTQSAYPSTHLGG